MIQKHIIRTRLESDPNDPDSQVDISKTGAMTPVKNQSILTSFRISKGSGLKNLGLIGFTLGLHLARIIIFVRAPSSKRPWAPSSTGNISGLQGSKNPTLRR